MGPRRVVGWVFVCALLLCLPSLSLQRSLQHEIGDGEVEGFSEPSPMFKWTGLGARALEVVFDDHGHDEPPHWDEPPPSPPPPHHHSPPPPSPSPPPPHSPPPPSPPPPSPPPPPPSPPPPPPPLAFLKDLQVSDGSLKPEFHPDVYHYNSTVGEKVSEVSVTATVFPEIKDYEIKVNAVELKSGESSPPIPIGSNGETVKFYITVGAHGYSTNTYFLSIYRNEKTSIWKKILQWVWAILKWVLLALLALLVLVLILLCCDRFFPQLRAYRWWPFGPRGGSYESVNPDPSPLVADRGV